MQKNRKKLQKPTFTVPRGPKGPHHRQFFLARASITLIGLKFTINNQDKT